MLAFCPAVGLNGAHQALRASRQADGGAQFHQRLVEVAWPLRVHQLIGQSLDFAGEHRPSCFACGLPAFKPAQNALHIAVHHSHPLSKGDAGNGG